MKRTILALSSLAAGLMTCGAQEMREISFMTAMPAEKSPVIDGVLDDACWAKGVPNRNYYGYFQANPKRVATKTSCTVLYDAKGVYVGVENMEPLIGKLVKNVTKDFDGMMYNDDCAEIYFDPDANGVGYYKFVVNSLGKHDSDWRMDAANYHYDWVAQGVVSAAKIGSDRWTFELFVPWSALHGRTAPTAGTVWTFNHSRFRMTEWGLSSSAPGGCGTVPEKFGYLYFSDGGKPDPDQVCDIIASRLSTVWGVAIGDRAYVHDDKGVRSANLDAMRREEIARYISLKDGLEKRGATRGRKDLAERIAKTYKAFTNETAAAEATFAGVKTVADQVGQLKDIVCELTMEAVLTSDVAVARHALPLAGQYDFDPPKTYNGYDGWYRHNIRPDKYRTARLDWFEEVRDRPKVLFLASFEGGAREMMERANRFPMEPSYFIGNFGSSSVWSDAVLGGTHLDKRRQFESLLARNPDVIVLAGIEWAAVPVEYRCEILRRIRDEGLGMLYLKPAWTMMAFQQKLPADVELEAELARIAAYRDLPEMSPGADETAKRVKVRKLGKGRIAFADGRSFGKDGRTNWFLGWKSAYESLCVADWNLIRAVQGVRPTVRLAFSGLENWTNIPQRVAYLPIAATASKDASGWTKKLSWRVRDPDGAIISKGETGLKAGETVVGACDVSALSGGLYYVDACATCGGEAEAVLSHPFWKQADVGRFRIESRGDSVPENGYLTVSAVWDVAVPRKGVLVVEVRDLPYGQLRRREELKVNGFARSCAFALRGPFPTLAGAVRMTLKDPAGRDVARADKLFYFPSHEHPDYLPISWDGLDSHGPEFLAPQLVEEFGYRAHMGGTASLSAAFNARAVGGGGHVRLQAGKDGVVNWSTFGGFCWDDKGRMKRFNELKGEINPYDPAVRALACEALTNRVPKALGQCVELWNLGDECGYSHDAGHGPQDRKYFPEFLAKKYGTIADFNRIRGTSYADFASVPHKTVQKAASEGDWASWYDHVQYVERMYSDAFQFLRGIIKKFDPKARVGAEGSAAGDLEQTVENLEFWGPYRSLVLDEVLRCIAPDRVRGIWWGGYFDNLRDGFPVQIWESLLQGTVNADLWFQVQPGSTMGAFGSDYTFAPYVERMLPHLKDIRRGQAQALIRTPFRNDGFGIYYSHASDHANKLDDRFTTSSSAALVRFCHRTGFAVQMITPKTLKKLDALKVLFLSSATSLSDAECAAILSFAKRGGTVVADMPPAVLDGYLQRRARNPLAELFGDVTYAALKPPVTGAVEASFDGVTVRGELVTHMPDEKPFAVHACGKGRGILCNMTFGTIADSAGLGTVDAILARILAAAEIRQQERIEGLPPTETVFRVRENGDVRLIGFKTVAKSLGSRIRIDLGKPGYVYAFGKGLVGKSAEIVEEKLDVPFKLYAVFADEQRPPDPKALVAGRIYRLETYAPDGKPMRFREKVFVAAAKNDTTKLIDAPLDEKPGTRYVLCDVMTGLSTELK